MKLFENTQCVKVNNSIEFKSIYGLLRSADSINCEDWIEQYGEPQFPVYLENTNSTFNGQSIGFTNKPYNTWNRSRLEVLSLSDIGL